MRGNKQLIERTTYNRDGLPVLEECYSKGKVTFTKQLYYYDGNQVKQILLVQGKDTTCFNYQKGEFSMEIIVGGLPGPATKVEYFANGLLKQKPASINGKYAIIEYHYDTR